MALFINIYVSGKESIQDSQILQAGLHKCPVHKDCMLNTPL